jgi:hypothetical protein
MSKLLLLLAALTLAACPALATLDGSTVNLVSPGTADPGETIEICFYVENGSPDGEYVREVRFILPEDSDILSGYFDDGGLGWSFDFSIYGEFDNYATFMDADSTNGTGEIAPNDSGYFYLTVFLHYNMDCMMQELATKLYGDETGDHPHWIRIYNYLELCGVPTVNDTWSNVKNLYR